MSVGNPVHLDLDYGVCGDGLTRGPIVADIFSVAEVSKQDICVYKRRKPGRVPFALPAFLLKGYIPLTP